MRVVDARTRARELAYLNAFISLTDEEGEGPVVAVKDVVDVRGSTTTAGATLLPTVAAPEDAPVIREIRRHGCVIVGKTNLHEWACGLSSANPHYGHVLNPADLNRIPGGSSGGSAVAVAAEMCDWAIGTDTGGSIRVPAALCGVVGLKPTIGLVNTQGVVPVSRTMDTLGPLAPDVGTAACALAMMTGRAEFMLGNRDQSNKLRVAVPTIWIHNLDSETRQVWDMIGNGLPEVQLPDLTLMTNVQQTIVKCEAASYHRRWLETSSDRYGGDVLEFLREGSQISASDYSDALGAREQLRHEVETAFRDYDALLLPTTPCVAPKVGRAESELRGLLNQFTRPFNVTGHPVVSLPCPTRGLPVGAQLIGHWGRDADLLRVALKVEAEWSQKRSAD